MIRRASRLLALTSLIGATSCLGGQTGEPEGVRGCSGVSDIELQLHLNSITLSPAEWEVPAALPLQLEVGTTDANRFSEMSLHTSSGETLFSGRGLLGGYQDQGCGCPTCYAASVDFSGPITNLALVFADPEALGAVSAEGYLALEVTKRPGQPPSPSGTLSIWYELASDPGVEQEKTYTLP